MVAEDFELVDELAGSAFGVDSVGVVVDAEVGETGVGIVEEVPDDLEDATGDRDLSALFASTAGKTPVLLAEKGVGPAGRRGGLTESTFEVAVPFTSATVLGLLPGLFGAWCDPSPRRPGGLVWGTGPCRPRPQR